MIQDPLRLTDGFRGLPAGMNGSRLPPLVDPTSVWYAENVTFRDGIGAKTRPGFIEIPPSFWRPALINGSGSTYETVDSSDTQVIGGSSTTSSQRYATYVKGGNYFQGSFLYQDPRAGNPAQIVLVIDGYIISLNFSDRSCFVLNPTAPITSGIPVYMTQAVRFLIIQNGIETPYVYDGYVLNKATTFGDGKNVVPIGKQMVYGQGRLFVASTDGTYITAGDLIYGGSTVAPKISTAVYDPSTLAGRITINTTTVHGLTVGTIITIQGLVSETLLNGTYTILTVPTTKSFTVASNVVNITSDTGVGGTVSAFNTGADTDLLSFTETTFISEGGVINIPTALGAITNMSFVPLQDTSTGQGDMVVLCSNGAVSLAVSNVRTSWSSTLGFQRVLYQNIGAVSDSSIVVNGDLFFRSLDGNGIRSYRSARAEFQGYGQVPVSAEIDPILTQDTQGLLSNVSFGYLNDRLLMTCWPSQTPPVSSNNGSPDYTTSGVLSGVTQAPGTNMAANMDYLVGQPVPILHGGVAVLDFRSTANGHSTAKAAFDGVWTGLNVLKILSGKDNGKQRAFLIAYNPTSVSGSTAGYTLWEVIENAESDLGAQGNVPISSTIITRSFNFNKVMDMKKLLRLDLWFDSIEGGPNRSLTLSAEYRPDDFPTWISWATDTKTFNTETTTYTSSSTPYPYLYDGYAPQLRLPTPAVSSNSMSAKPAYLGYDFNFRIKWTGHARCGRLLIHALQVVEPVGGGAL